MTGVPVFYPPSSRFDMASHCERHMPMVRARLGEACTGYTIDAGLADAHCVMHRHTTATMAVCCLKNGLSLCNFYAVQLHGQLAHHDFAGITVHLDEGRRILASAGGKKLLLLHNHGPVVIGASLAHAFGLMWLLQRACEVQLAAQPLGRLRAITTPVLEGCVRDSLNFNPNFGAGQDVFDAVQRLVDRVDPSSRG